MVIEKIFEHARRTPGKLAISYGTRGISYRCFSFWISHARELLRQQALRSGCLAVLIVDCLVDSWVFGLALRSLGMTTIAVRSLDWLDRLSLHDIGCVVMTTRDRAPSIAPAGSEFKLIQIPRSLYLRNVTEGVPDSLRMASPAGGHILLTSGTTGTSKKVLIDDAHLTRVIPRRAEVYGVSERSIANVFAFAMSTGTAYKMPTCVWSVGGTVVIYQGPDQHKSLLVDGITHAFFTPGTLSELLEVPDIPRSETMQAFVVGGPLPRALASAARIRLTPHIFACINSTESGPWAVTRIERDEDLRSHCIHPSVEVQVVDEADRPLPVGQTGLVRIRTADIATSYLDDEDASRAAFRQGYFYSGDLGTFQADGRLVLQGRVNNVINVLGIKVGAEVMELAIQERLAVDGVCVLSRQDEGMVAEFHVVIQSRRPVGQAELASAIGPWLPGIPRYRVHFVNPLPRTDTGKIDRAALRQQVFAASAGSPA
jgi:fatty-acyl-CoA synthase